MPNPEDSVDTGKNARQAWAEIISLSQQLLQHARDRDWDAVAELHVQREALIRGFFREPVSPEHAEEIREAIRAVLKADTETVALMREEKGEAAAMIQRFQSGREANKAYASIEKERKK